MDTEGRVNGEPQSLENWAGNLLMPEKMDGRPLGQRPVLHPRRQGWLWMNENLQVSEWKLRSFLLLIFWSGILMVRGEMVNLRNKGRK